MDPWRIITPYRVKHTAAPINRRDQNPDVRILTRAGASEILGITLPRLKIGECAATAGNVTVHTQNTPANKRVAATLLQIAILNLETN